MSRVDTGIAASDSWLTDHFDPMRAVARACQFRISVYQHPFIFFCVVILLNTAYHPLVPTRIQCQACATRCWWGRCGRSHAVHVDAGQEYITDLGRRERGSVCAQIWPVDFASVDDNCRVPH